MTQAIEVFAEAIASEVMKNLQSTIERKVERAMSDYIDGQDFIYQLEEVVKDKMESMVEDYVDGVSLSIRVD
jgi:Mor family transcriptional regulator